MNYKMNEEELEEQELEEQGLYPCAHCGTPINPEVLENSICGSCLGLDGMWLI
jgi:hypothetical protein